MRKTSVYLPPRLKEALAARAAATGRSEAEVIRAALETEVWADPPVGAGRPAGPLGAGDPGGLGAGRPAGPLGAGRAGTVPGGARVGVGAEAAIGGDGAVAAAPVPGRLVGVGVGPGEADLVTVRALIALRRADRVVAPALAVDAVGRAEAIVRQAVPGLRVERVAFAMAPGRAERDRSVEEAAGVLVRYLAAGEEVAFVTLGDPLLYSTFTSVAAAVRRRRPVTVVEQVPGVMAFQALAARTGTTVTDERQRLVVRTALDGDDVEVELSDPDVTVVLYKGGRRLPDLAKAAAAAGRLPGAIAGELLGMPGERIGPLSELAADGPASYLATVIIPAGAPHPVASPGPGDAGGAPDRSATPAAASRSAAPGVPGAPGAPGAPGDLTVPSPPAGSVSGRRPSAGGGRA